MILCSVVFYLVDAFLVITRYMPTNFFHGLITDRAVHSYILALSSGVRFGVEILAKVNFHSINDFG